MSTPELVDLKCRNCGSTLTSDAISIPLSAARCPHCQSLFAVVLPAPQAPPVAPRPRIPLPKRFTVEHGPGELLIIRRWLSPIAYFLTFFCLFWNGFLVVWHTIALSSGMWFMSAFGLIHTAVGIGLAYFTLALYINRTTLRVSRTNLSIRHHPLPWKGRIEHPSKDLTQLYVTEKTHQGKNGSSSSSYQLQAILRSGERLTLLSGLPQSDHALFLEQSIESFLQIPNQSVPSEVLD